MLCESHLKNWKKKKIICEVWKYCFHIVLIYLSLPSCLLISLLEVTIFEENFCY